MPIHDDTIEAPAAWLPGALRFLRLGEPDGLAPLADRQYAARLLVALEMEGPAPYIGKCMGMVAIRWVSGVRDGRITIRNRQVIERRVVGTVVREDEWHGKPIDRVRDLVAWVRGGDGRRGMDCGEGE